MNYKLTITLAVVFGLYGCQQEAEQVTATDKAETTVAPAAIELVSGIDQTGFNEAVRPQDDFFAYVNGTWVDNTEMPTDKARWGTFDALGEQSQKDVRALVDEVSATQGVATGSPTQKIRDFYNSYMNAESVTTKGISAIREDLDAIIAIKNMDDVYSAFSSLGVYGVTTPNWYGDLFRYERSGC